MKILKLNFNNIHSLKGKSSIDFTLSPLANAGIFAIIGPTGSGKSTLLDIISLSLYNRTPRIGVLSKNAVKSYGSVITRNTDECFAEVEYEIKNKRYRSKWEISVARTGELRDYDMELSEITDDSEGKIISSKKSEIPTLNTEIIGLNYDQFIKSIVLSQGDFAKFLKATPDERGDLLEKITGTEIYRRIGKAAFEKQKEEKIKLDLLNVKIESINLLTKDEVFELVELQKNEEITVSSNNLLLQKLSELFTVKQNIRNLQIKHAELKKQSEKIENEVLNFENQLLKLRKHEKLINLKSEILELKNNNSQKINLHDKIEIANKNLIEITKKHQQNAESLIKLNLEKEKLEKEFEILLPKIKKARELDFSLSNLDSKINETRALFQKKSNNFKLDTTKKEEIEKKIISEKSEIEKSENWYQKNIILEELEKEFSLLKEKIQVFKQESKSTNLVINKLNDKKLITELSKSTTWENKKNVTENFIKSIKIHETEIDKQLKFEISEKLQLELKIENLKNQHDIFKSQLQIAENYNKSKIKLSEINNQNVEISKSISEIENTINDKVAQKEIVEKYIEELKIKKERQQLEAKYSDDRQKLILGDECFLCGSKQHPYVTNYENKLDQTSKLLKQKEDEYKKLVTEIQNITKLQTENQSIFKTNNQKISELNSEIEKQVFDFTELNKQSDIKSNIEEIPTIANSVKTVIEEAKNIKIQIELIGKLTDLKAEIQNTENIFEKISDINLKEKSVFENLLKYQNFTKNSTDFSVIIENLESEIKNLNSVKEQITNLRNSIFANENLVLEKTEVLEKLKVELLEQKTELDNLKNDSEKLKAERFELLENKQPDEVENQIRKSIKLNSEKISENEKIIAKLISDKQNIETNIQNLKSEFENLNQTIVRQEEYLFPKLTAEGYKNIDEALKFLLSEQEVEKIKKEQTNLHDRKTSVIQSIKDNSTEIEKHEVLDDKSTNFEDTEKNIKELKSSIETKNRKIGIIKNKLEENKKRNEESKLLFEQYHLQEKEFERWNALNELIGDATGKKFTLYAQQITLSQLITLANEHLTKLNDRYILKKSEQSIKDNLIVIDTYMANSERSVQTLSGGESFLLSLALALGLSDLASKNTKIESLFIDEGFGTLDQQTLDKALSTLEILQSQTNRTIGIISHVQAIKERITTQIELVKQNSGYSSIEIR